MSNKSDGSTASYYELPTGCAELQDLISHRDMNAQMGEIFRATYRYGQASHSDQLRDAKKIKFYIDAEIKRLQGKDELLVADRLLCYCGGKKHLMARFLSQPPNETVYQCEDCNITVVYGRVEVDDET